MLCLFHLLAEETSPGTGAHGCQAGSSGTNGCRNPTPSHRAPHAGRDPGVPAVLQEPDLPGADQALPGQADQRRRQEGLLGQAEGDGDAGGGAPRAGGQEGARTEGSISVMLSRGARMGCCLGHGLPVTI